MELKCPQCAKILTVSQEELVIHGSQVVCPQCLAVCRYENGALVVRDDSDAPYRHTATVESKPDNSRFCHSCGKQLPSGISFCPYCGVDLKAPFSTDEPVAAEPEPKAQPVEEKKPSEKKEKTSESYSSRRQSSSQVEDKLRTIPHHYNSMAPHMRQSGTAPGRTFKLIAYIIIAALLILLVCIIVAGNKIEPSI